MAHQCNIPTVLLPIKLVKPYINDSIILTIQKEVAKLHLYAMTRS